MSVLFKKEDDHVDLEVSNGGAPGGGWCGLNFWRSRHAHCLVTGPAWLALALFTFAEASLGRTLIHGYEQLVFLGVLAAGLAFEGAWYVARRTNAVMATVVRPG